MSSRGPVIGEVANRRNNERKHMHFDEPAPHSSSSRRQQVEEVSNRYNDDYDQEESEQEGGSDENEEDAENSASDYDEEANSKLPLFERLARSQERSEGSSSQRSARKSQLKLKKERVAGGSSTGGDKKIGRANKNAPAVMMSNKPVRRLRIEANNSVKKSIDPRFSDISGKANEQIFAKNYSFLDDYRQDEIQELSGVMKKLKSAPKKAELKGELIRMKQEATERRRGLKVMQRFEALKAEEREKVKAGKKPFFLKAAARKAVGLEERYSELKREGKLNKFMNKKRKKNSNKDHRWLPSRREE